MDAAAPRGAQQKHQLPRQARAAREQVEPPGESGGGGAYRVSQCGRGDPGVCGVAAARGGKVQRSAEYGRDSSHDKRGVYYHEYFEGEAMGGDGRGRE